MTKKKTAIKDYSYGEIGLEHLLPQNMDENKTVAFTFLDRPEHIKEYNKDYVVSSEIYNAFKVVLEAGLKRVEGEKTEISRHIWVSGPKGSGKSSAAEEMAKRVGIPLVRIPCSRTTGVEELFGSFGMKGGETFFNEGPLSKGIREGAMVVLEEMDVLPTTITGLINTVLDGSEFTNPVSQEVMAINPLFFAFATANTMGFGDETGSYSGTQKQNSATMSRFLKCKVDYLPPQLEIPMVASKFLKVYYPDKAPNAKTKALYQEITSNFVEHEFAKKLVELANQTRMMHIKDQGTIETPLSTRELVAIAVNYPIYQNVSNALALSIYNSYSAQLPEPSRAWLEEVSARVFGNNMKAEFALKPVETPRGFKIKA